MRTRIGYGLAGVVILLMVGVGMSLQAQSGALPLDKIGVVSVMRVMSESKKNVEQMQSLQMQQAQHQAELQQLSQELETDKASLQTMVPGSEDHLTQMKTVFEKQATLEGRQEYYRQLLSAKDREMTEQVYRKTLAATNRVAEAKGLTLVLEQSAPEFPIPGERLVLAISSNKVLYSKGCVDITDAVLLEVDKD